MLEWLLRFVALGGVFWALFGLFGFWQVSGRCGVAPFCSPPWGWVSPVSMLFKVFSWNVRGRNAVRLVVSSIRGAVVCLQETKVQSVSCSFLRSVCGSYPNKCQFVRACGSSGGLITCWSSKHYDCTDVIVRNFSITVHLAHRASGVKFFVTNVYGPASREGKDSFCSELALLKHSVGGNWVLCGAFNLTSAREDRKGTGGGGISASHMFNDLIDDLALINLPMKNQRFTWSNWQRSPILAKLDRFLVSTEWDATYPLSEVEALPRCTSDHCPILLSMGGKSARRGNVFRFEEVWLKREDFIANVPLW